MALRPPTSLFLLLGLVLAWLKAASAEHSPQDSAPLARRLLASSTLGDVSTIMTAADPFPDLQGSPFSTPEYIADDCTGTGNILLYLVTWGTHAQNIHSDPRVSISISHPNFTLPDPTDSRGSLDEPRMAVLGSAAPVRDHDGKEGREAARRCFFQRHPDAETFPHRSEVYRVETRVVRWIGGFGDRHFNGWIDGRTWRRGNHEDGDGDGLVDQSER
ncbi:hypothetical protein HKX48_002632 [Thoreauomyces humboldtii]|nr:hypothetical protein HKX48_002632 [Thoreauomyces humboldtii]